MTKLHESVHIENAVCHKVSGPCTRIHATKLKIDFISLPKAYHLLSLQIVFDLGSVNERIESIVHHDQWLLEE